MKPSTQSRPKPRRKPKDTETTTLDRIRKRTIEIAAMAGRGPLEIRRSDYEKAKLEVTGESAPERQHAVLFSGGA